MGSLAGRARAATRSPATSLRLARRDRTRPLQYQLPNPRAGRRGSHREGSAVRGDPQGSRYSRPQRSGQRRSSHQALARQSFDRRSRTTILASEAGSGSTRSVALTSATRSRRSPSEPAPHRARRDVRRGGGELDRARREQATASSRPRSPASASSVSRPCPHFGRSGFPDCFSQRRGKCPAVERRGWSYPTPRTRKARHWRIALTGADTGRPDG